MLISEQLYQNRRKAEQEALANCIQNLDIVEADPLYKDPTNPTRGKCYYAALALYQYLGGRAQGYQFIKAVEPEELGSGTHYWVRNSDGEVLDPTAAQFVILGRLPPYSVGKPVSARPNYTKHLALLEAMKRR